MNQPIEQLIAWLAGPGLTLFVSHLLEQYGGARYHNLSSATKLILSNLVQGLGAWVGYWLGSHVSAAQMAQYDPLIAAGISALSLVLGLVFHLATKKEQPLG